MSVSSATPLMIDTGAFYARVDSDDAHHETATEFFERIRTGELPYRPLYTTQAVLAEAATLCRYKLDHDVAVRMLTAVRDSESITILPVGPDTFETAATQFAAYDDQEIPFVDHTTAVLAADHDIEYLFAFDDDFRTLGFTIVPDDEIPP